MGDASSLGGIRPERGLHGLCSLTTLLPMLELCLRGPTAQEGLLDPVFVRISIAVLNRHNQKQPGEYRVSFNLHIIVHHGRESWQELKARQESGSRN